MHDASTLWSILALYFLAAGLIGGLLPTWPLSVTATVTFALAFLMLALVDVPEISLDLAQLVIAIAMLAGALGHLVRRVARVWWRTRQTGKKEAAPETNPRRLLTFGNRR